MKTVRDARNRTWLLAATAGALLSSGCVAHNTYRRPVRSTPGNPDGPALAVFKVCDKTTGEFGLLWDEGHWTWDKEEWLNTYTEALAATAKNSGLFSRVEVLADVEAEDLPRAGAQLSQRGYDFALVGDILEAREGGASHPLAFVNPLSVLLFVGLPTGLGIESGYQRIALSLVALPEGKSVWSDETRKESMNQVGWTSLWGINNIWVAKNRHCREITQMVADDVERKLKIAGEGELSVALRQETRSHPAPVIGQAAEQKPAPAARPPATPAVSPVATPAVLPVAPPAVSPVAPPAAPPPTGRAFAVVVGLSKYQRAGEGGLTELAFADDDAQAFASSLKRQGWDDDHIRLLLNEQATFMNVRVALESWLTKAGPGDLVVLFWSGHAFPDPENPEKVYFACYDTNPAVPATGYNMEDAHRALKERAARNTVVLADTCHAGRLATRGLDRAIGVRPYVERIERERAVPKGWVFMVGAETDRQAIESTAWSNGAFTHCLLEGLSGQADGYHSAGRQDGVVTLGELRAWMESAMPEETQKVLGVAKRPFITTSTGDPDIWNLSLRMK